MRWYLLAVGLLAFFFGCAASSAPRRPQVDRQAMREAISSGASGQERFSSSASYAHYLRARLFHHRGEHRSALDQLRLALASDDGNPFLLTALAEEHARLGEAEKAERELGKAIEQNPDYPPAQLLLGRVLLEAEKISRARVHLGRAIQLRPQDPEAYLVLAQLWLEQGKPEQAIRVVENLASSIPGEPAGYKRLGLALAEREDYPRAERMLRRAAARDPGDVETWGALANVLEAAERLAEAEEAYSRALEQDPESRPALLAAGRLALRQDAPERARAYFDQLLGVSEEPELVVKVAFSYLATRQLAAAAEVLERARQRSFAEPRLHFYAGLMQEKLGRHLQAAQAYAGVGPEAGELFQEARARRANVLSLGGQHQASLELFQQALAERPDSFSLCGDFSRALERSGQRKEAELFLRDRLKLHPAPELFEALARLYERQGRLAEATELLLGALARQPRDEVLLYTLGTTYEKQGDLDRSLEQMRALLELNPQHAHAMNFIGYVLAQQGRDFAEAELLLGKALALHPDNGAFLDSLGWVYFRQGSFERAAQTLERAVTFAPGDPTIIEHLGDTYSRLFQKEKAAELYRQALEALLSSPELAEHQGQLAGLEEKLKKLSSEVSGRLR